jgi:hypothetical protein
MTYQERKLWKKDKPHRDALKKALKEIKDSVVDAWAGKHREVFMGDYADMVI